MPTTVAGVVPVLRTLAEHNRAAAQQRNGILDVVTKLIRIVLDNPELLD